MQQVCIKFSTLKLIVKLRDTPTAQVIWNALPIESRTQTWQKTGFINKLQYR